MSGLSMKVLVVDDNEDDRIAIRFALRETGCEMETASSVGKGLVAAEIFRPDVIIVDYSLREANGIEFISRLKEEFGAALPQVILITGVGSELVAVQALRAGAADYLIKDVEGHYLKLLPAVLERLEQRSQMQAARLEAERQLQLAANVVSAVTDGILVTAVDGTILSVNPALCAITGYTPKELLGATPRLFKSGRHEPEFYQGMWDCLARNGQWCGEIWNRRKDGSCFLARETITIVLDDHGRRINNVAVMTDLVESKAADNEMWHRAHHDALTDLPNRSLFLDRLRHRLAYALRHGQRLSVLFIDLDRFKPVNDGLGHDVGDEVLQQVAKRLAAGVRQSDTMARHGGDEFVAILNDTSECRVATAVAEKLIQAVAEPLDIAGYRIEIGASVGIACFPEHGTTPLALVKAADNAMYEAKRRGGACVGMAAEQSAAASNETAPKSARRRGKAAQGKN